jgi:hypothetical protein
VTRLGFRGLARLGAILAAVSTNAALPPAGFELQGKPGAAATVTFRSLRDAGEAPITVKTTLPYHGELPVASGAPWSVHIEGPELFPCDLEIARAPTSLRLADLARLTGQVEAAAGSNLPERVRARILASPTETAFSSVCGSDSYLVDCKLEEQRFECPLPAGRLDLRLEVFPYAPVYLWDVAAKPGPPNEIASIPLRTGASLAGWIETQAPMAPGARPRVVATRRLMGDSSDSEARRLGALAHEAVVSPRLFFQIVGLPVGVWDLTAEAPGFAPARSGPFAVEEGKETQVEDPLELHPPITLSIYLDPATDWEGSPWRILLKRSRPLVKTEEVVADREAGLQGDVLISDLEAGEYRLEVMDFRDGSWSEQLVEVRPEMPPIFLGLAAVKVAGELLLGSESVAGTVVFGAYGRPRVPVKTDEVGRFTAVLPRAGEWQMLVELRGLEIRVPPIEIGKQGEKNLSIRLPDTSVRGTVFLDGEPVADASVVLRRDDESLKPLGSVVTDAKGKFELLGLETGPVRAAATLGKVSSQWMGFELRETSPAEIELHLSKTRAMAGFIKAGGAPAPGAAVIALVGELESLPAAQQALSGADGGVIFELPAKTQSFDVLVIEPSLGVTWRRLKMPPAGTSFEVSLPAAKGRLNVLLPNESFEGWYLAHGDSVLHFRVLFRWLSEVKMVEQRLSDLAFQLHGVEAGGYNLCERTPGGFGNCVSGYLAPGGELDLAPAVE